MIPCSRVKTFVLIWMLTGQSFIFRPWFLALEHPSQGKYLPRLESANLSTYGDRFQETNEEAERLPKGGWSLERRQLKAQIPEGEGILSLEESFPLIFPAGNARKAKQELDETVGMVTVQKLIQ